MVVRVRRYVSLSGGEFRNINRIKFIGKKKKVNEMYTKSCHHESLKLAAKVEIQLPETHSDISD
jgi:hypothetical protein